MLNSIKIEVKTNMKLVSVVFLLFAVQLTIYSQPQAMFTKGSFVVPKFSAELLGFKSVSVWSGRMKYTTSVSQTADGLTVVNGKTDWKDAGWSFRTDFPVKEVKTSKKGTFVKLQNDQFEIELNFDPAIKDINKAMNDVFYPGNFNSFKLTEYYQTDVVDRFIPRIFKGVLVNITSKEKLEMIDYAGYNLDALGIFDYKDKQYLRCEIANGTSYNTRVVSDSQRTSTVIKGKLLEPIKFYFSKVKEINGVDGLKMVITIFYRDFISDLSDKKDSLEIYLPKEEIGKFIDADITNQELMNKSIVILNGNRIQVDLNNSVSN
jgi:hypothetical protein